MPIRFSTQQKIILHTGDESEAALLLAPVLQDPNITLPEMGELALQFFQFSRYQLAAMVFAKWIEREPNNPEPWANLGYSLLKQNKPNDALELTQHALSLDSNYFPAQSNLCDIFQQLGQFDQQLAVAQACVEQHAKSCVAHNNLGTALWYNGKVSEAKQAFQNSFKLDPQYFEARLNLGKLLSDEGEHDEATAEFESLLKHHGLNQATQEVLEFYLAFEYLNAGKLQTGWQLYERGFSPHVPTMLARNPVRTFHVPRWQGQALKANEQLLIWREQGIGDELRFLALLQLLKVPQSQWVIETDPRLIDVLQRSFPHAQVRQEQTHANALPQGGYHIPAGSLPSLLMSAENQNSQLAGYLKADAWQVDRFAKRLSEHANKTKIGICWRSHKTSAVRNKKYAALKDWDALLRRPDTCFVSLQYGDAEQEITEMEKSLGISILRWSDVDLKDDLDAVLGLMQNLDQVVSTSTAVVPLAGALGRPTIFLGHASWVLLGQKGSYPWHDSVHPVLVPRNEAVSTGTQAVIEKLNQKL